MNPAEVAILAGLTVAALAMLAADPVGAWRSMVRR